MKKKSTLLLSLFAASLVAVPLSVSLSSCNGNGENTDTKKENYVVDWKVVLTQSGQEDKNNPSSIEGFVNETASLRGVVIQSTIEDKEADCTFTFESEDEEIATISKTGEIEFLKEGKELIAALLISLLLVTFIPAISTFLPTIMK